MGKENEVEIIGDLNEVEKAIYGEKTKDYGEKEFDSFRKNAIKEILKMTNNEKYDEMIINDLINYLNNVSIVKDKRKKKYLTFDELVEMEQNTKIENAQSFWKAMLLGFIVNIMDNGEYQYRLTNAIIDKIVYDLWSNENIYEVIDSEISHALMDYEKKVREQ